MSYAICRIIKLKRSNLAGSDTHVSRTRPTQNVNPSVTPQNKSLISTDDRSPLQDLVAAKIALTHQGAVRSNAVHAVELLLSASPGYFRPNKPTEYGAYDPVHVGAWAQHNIEWLKQEYGDRIVRAILHLDEATPHIHAYLVPIDAKGQLNCRGIFGERKNMFALQDSYAAAMEPLGIERGIRGSKARHTDVNKYYTVVNEFCEGGGASVVASLQAENARLEQRLSDLTDERDSVVAVLQAENARLDQFVSDITSERDKLKEKIESLPINIAGITAITNQTKASSTGSNRPLNRSPISDGDPRNHIRSVLAIALKDQPTATPPEIVTPLPTVTLPKIEDFEMVTVESVVAAVPSQQPELRELVKDKSAIKTTSGPRQKHRDLGGC